MRDKVYFISDLHLGAGYIPDRHAHERRIAAWLDEITPTAKALYLLGDVLDYWYEYRTVVPRGYVRFFGALARMADAGVEIVWFKGNHDTWIFDYLPSEIGLKVVDGVLDTEILGHRFVMEHGDGVGEMRRSYRLIHRVFRNRFAQRLYSAIHPRWTVGFAHRWSSHSRKNGCRPRPLNAHSTNDPLISWSLNYAKQNGHVDYFVYGHRHIEADVEIAPDTRLIVLGDAFRLMTYGCFDGREFTLNRISE